LLASILVCLAAAACHAEKHELTYAVSGTDIGKNIYEIMPDGTFTSETNLAVAGMKISSTLTGRIADGKLVAFDLRQNMNGKEGSISAANGKVKLTGDGKTSEKEFKPPKVFFADYHPFVAVTAGRAFDMNGSPKQKIDVMLLDAMEVMQADVSRKPARTIEVGGKREAVQVFQIGIATVTLDTFVNERGDVVGWSVPTQKLTILETGYGALLVDPTTLIAGISQPTFKVKVEKKVMAKMRDGVALAADIARPDAAGKFPAILVRTPYGRGASMLEADWWAKRGYVYACQDVRGRGDSKGKFVPFAHERKDGYDTIGWLSKQPWCDGKVGMIGGSYLGWVQWWAAVEAPPALKCIVPQVSPPDPFFNLPFDHGIPMLFGAVWWAKVIGMDTPDASILGAMKNTDKFGTGGSTTPGHPSTVRTS
jgi:hypothetical protein